MPKNKSAPKLLSEIESAIHLKMSPLLLQYFTKNAVKYKEKRKLPCTVNEGGTWYSKDELDSFNAYLRSPWPKSPKAQRPRLPSRIRDEIMHESCFVCAICGFESAGEAAHLEAVSATKCHHPENLLWLCPNHHTVIDDVAQLSNVKLPVAKTIKSMLVERNLRLWRHELALESNILALIRQVERIKELLAEADLKDAHNGLKAVASLDLKTLASQADKAAKAPKLGIQGNASLAFVTKVSKSASKASAGKALDLDDWQLETKAARAEFLEATGQVDCPLCNGSGYHKGADCPVCQGDGSIREADEPNFDPADYHDADCPVCNGKGVLRGEDCPACHGDRQMEKRFADRIDVSEFELVECPVCSGRGHRRGEDCPACDGDRRIPSRTAALIELTDYEDVDCKLCQGSGRFRGYDCKPCGGAGQMPGRFYDRIQWHDFDLVSCPKCSGKGQSDYGDCQYCGAEGEVFKSDIDRF